MVDRLQASTESVAELIVEQNGEPVYMLLEYDLYQMLKGVIGELRKAQRNQPELFSETERKALRRQIQYLEGLIQAFRISAEIEKDPSTLVSHAELKRRLAEKKAALEKQHVAA